MKYKTIHKKPTQHERFEVTHDSTNGDNNNSLKRIRIYNSFRAMTQHYTLKLMNEKSGGGGGNSIGGASIGSGGGGSLHSAASGMNSIRSNIPPSKVSRGNANISVNAAAGSIIGSRRSRQAYAIDGYDNPGGETGGFGMRKDFILGRKPSHSASEAMKRKVTDLPFQEASAAGATLTHSSGTNTNIPLPSNGIFMPESQTFLPNVPTQSVLSVAVTEFDE